jgi:hypothetical protein
MIGSIFRVTDVKSNLDSTWNVRMELYSENVHQLQSLFQHMKTEVNNKQAKSKKK